MATENTETVIPSRDKTTKSVTKNKSIKKPAKTDKPKRKSNFKTPEQKILETVNKGGRPTKLTTEVEERIVSAVRGGNYLETAAAYAGIDKTTLHDWLRKGERGQGTEFIKFSHSVKKAMAESEMLGIARIQKAGADGAWQAEAWRLERRFAERWAKKPEAPVTIQTTAGETKITLGDVYKQINEN